jgi:hypothetical protein
VISPASFASCFDHSYNGKYAASKDQAGDGARSTACFMVNHLPLAREAHVRTVPIVTGIVSLTSTVKR